MAGAMEDWGLVSFRSAYLVFDEQVMTPESLRQVTLVIAHELAHQVNVILLTRYQFTIVLINLIQVWFKITEPDLLLSYNFFKFLPILQIFALI